MSRKYPPRNCAQHDCKISFTPRRRNQIYCTEQCRINSNNDNHRNKSLTDYKHEKEIKKNEKILGKAMASPVYKNDEINASILEYENFKFNITSDITKNKNTGGMIRWCHTYGVESKNQNPQTFSIHKRKL